MTPTNPSDNWLLLGNVFKPGFNYQGFAAAISADNGLTQAQKNLALLNLNPGNAIKFNTDLLHGFVDAAFGSFIAQPPKYRALETDHPTQQIWNDVWQLTLRHHEPEIDTYFEKRGAAQPDITILPEWRPLCYPMQQPKLRVNTVGQFISASIRDELTVTEEFLNLPPRQQAAILIHEAAHYLEPVTAYEEYTTPEANFHFRQQISPGSNRTREHLADALTVPLGYGEDLKEAFNTMALHENGIYARGKRIYDTATRYNFSLDIGKFASWMTDVACNAPEVQGNDAEKERVAQEITRNIQKGTRQLGYFASGHFTEDTTPEASHPTYKGRFREIDRLVADSQIPASQDTSQPFPIALELRKIHDYKTY